MGSLTTRAPLRTARRRSALRAWLAAAFGGFGGLGVGGLGLGWGEVDRVAVFVDDRRVVDEEAARPCPVRGPSVPPRSAPRRSRSLRTFAGFSPSRSASWSISASTSSSVTSMRLLRDDGAQREVGAHRAGRAVSRTLSTNASWSWPVAARYCGMVTPCACSSSRCARSWRRRSISWSTSVSGTSIVDELGGGVEHLVAHERAAPAPRAYEVEPLCARRRAARRRCRTR